VKFLVAGLGSMGRRRIRCLKALGHSDIVGFDIRGDRREEASRLYNIKTVKSISDAEIGNVDAVVLSVPPHMHVDYMKIAVDERKPAFIEASVVLDGLDEINDRAKQTSVFLAPSCTLRFHPVVKEITEINKSGKYGKFTNFSYHSGQYLPDWHPWEDVQDYYVSRKDTGGGREIVPFELTWIVDTIGWPTDIRGFYGPTMDVGAEIDDSYAIALKFEKGYGTLLVDVVARHATRRLILNMEYGQIVWNWDDGYCSLFDARNRRWIVYHQPESQGAEGYNKNIIESMYIEELDSFINKVKGISEYPHSLDDDIKVLKLLYRVEKE
jgi:predicted dehydrogenase